MRPRTASPYLAVISSPVPLKLGSRAPVPSLTATSIAVAFEDDPCLAPLVKEKPERIRSGKLDAAPLTLTLLTSADAPDPFTLSTGSSALPRSRDRLVNL